MAIPRNGVPCLNLVIRKDDEGGLSSTTRLFHGSCLDLGDMVSLVGAPHSSFTKNLAGVDTFFQSGYVDVAKGLRLDRDDLFQKILGPKNEKFVLKKFGPLCLSSDTPNLPRPLVESQGQNHDIYSVFHLVAQKLDDKGADAMAGVVSIVYFNMF